MTSEWLAEMESKACSPKRKVITVSHENTTGRFQIVGFGASANVLGSHPTLSQAKQDAAMLDVENGPYGIISIAAPGAAISHEMSVCE